MSAPDTLPTSKRRHSRPPGPCSILGCDRPARHRGLCNACLVAEQSADLDREIRLKPGTPRTLYKRDEVLDEWVFLRGWVPFEGFGARLGLNQTYWETIFSEAAAAGDPRAVRARNDPRAWPDPAGGLAHVLSVTRGRAA